MLSRQRIYLDTINNGGSSYNLKGDKPESGYMVALMGRELTVKPDWFNCLTVNQYINNNLDALENTDCYVGAWLDTDTNTIYLDVSINVIDLEDATTIGKQSGQTAVYDVLNKRTINC